MTVRLRDRLGAETPMSADHVVVAVFRRARIAARWPVPPFGGDPVHALFGRCRALHGGFGRSVPAAG